MGWTARADEKYVPKIILKTESEGKTRRNGLDRDAKKIVRLTGAGEVQDIGRQVGVN